MNKIHIINYTLAKNICGTIYDLKYLSKKQ